MLRDYYLLECIVYALRSCKNIRDVTIRSTTADYAIKLDAIDSAIEPSDLQLYIFKILST